MSDVAKNFAIRRKEISRRRKLLDLLKKIRDGEVEVSSGPKGYMFNGKEEFGPRRHYVDPKSRSTYNYGYMEEFHNREPQQW